MARIAGIELNDKSQVVYALTSIKGLGWSLSKRVLKKAGVDPARRVVDLTTEEIASITKALDGVLIEGELIRQVRTNIARLKTIGSYRGARHSKALPVRGQRTKTNARTKRGKRKTVGAFRKEALAKMQQQKEKKEKAGGK